MLDPATQAFYDALLARMPTSKQPRVVDAPEREVVRSNGEVVVLPAVPALDLDDEPGWRAYVQRLLAAPCPEAETWRRRLDRDGAAPVLALREGERPGSPYLSDVLKANVSANPSAGARIFLTAGMQETLVGLLIAQHVVLDVSSLGEAAGCANPRLLQRLIAALEQNHQVQPGTLSLAGGAASGVDLLHQAVNNPNSSVTEIMERLLSHGAPIDQVSRTGTTPLAEAVNVHNVTAVKLLIQHGANLDLSGSGDDAPLFLAIRLDKGELVTILLEAGARTELPNGVQTALEAAVDRGAIKALQALLDHGLDPFPLTVPGDPRSSRTMTLLDKAKAQMEKRPDLPKHRQCVNLLEEIALRQVVEVEVNGSTLTARGRSRL